MGEAEDEFGIFAKPAGTVADVVLADETGADQRLYDEPGRANVVLNCNEPRPTLVVGAAKGLWPMHRAPWNQASPSVVAELNVIENHIGVSGQRCIAETAQALRRPGIIGI